MKTKYTLALFSISVVFSLVVFGAYKTLPRVLSATDHSVFGSILERMQYLSSNSSFSKIETLAGSKHGTFGIYIEDLFTGDIYEYNSTTEMYAASLFKLPMVGSVLKQADNEVISLDDKVVYTAADTSGGTGTINNSAVGTEYSYEELITKMLKDSDNTAQMMVTRTLGWDLIKSAYLITPNQENFYETNITSAKNYAQLLKAYYQGDYLSRESRTKLFTLASQTSFDNRIHAGLRDNVVFSHKIGSWPDDNSWHDCGIATYNSNEIVVCLMSTGTSYADFSEVAKSVGKFISGL